VLRDRRVVFDGRFLQFVVDEIALPDGTRGSRELVLHPGASAVLPVLATGEFLLVSQHRHAVGEDLWEIPAGKLEPGEAPLACAKRELIEETGHTATMWSELLWFYTTPGFSDERIILFLAEGLKRVGSPDSSEIGRCRAFSLDEAMGGIRTGWIHDAKTILAVLLYHTPPPSTAGRGKGVGR